MKLPKLYAIADRVALDARGMSVGEFAREMAWSGVRLLQYRDKVGAPNEVLRAAREIAAEFAGVDAMLILNDRADLAVLAGWGVHVGQGDLSVEDARRIVGIGCVVGVSTHNDAQVRAADVSVALSPGSENPDPGHPNSLVKGLCMGADYVAVGPVFGTSTKVDAEPVVGLDGVRRARALTRRLPEGRALVAIGGITRENARSVIEAGADSVAVIGGLLVAGERPGKIAKEFLELLK